MTTTTIKLTINHKTKLPDGLTDVVADRAYQYIHAKGGHAGDVTAEIVEWIYPTFDYQAFETFVRSRGGDVMMRDREYVSSMTREWLSSWNAAMEFAVNKKSMISLPVVSLPEVKEQHARLLRKVGV